MNPIPNYDGSRPEPPYNTDTDAVVMLQGELDTLREELAATKAELERVRRNHIRRMRWIAECWEWRLGSREDMRSHRYWRHYRKFAMACLSALSQKNKTETLEGGHG